MSSNSHTQTIVEIAESQMGLFTTAQAERFGVPRNVVSHMTKVGKAERLEQGVYRMGGIPFDEQQGIYAVWLSTNPDLMAFERHANFDGIVVGGRSAAALHGFGDFFLSPYRFLTRKRINSRRKNVTFTTSQVREIDVEYLNSGLPVTSLCRTIYDLEMDNDDPSQIEQIARHMHRSAGGFNTKRLHELLAEGSRRGRNRNLPEIEQLIIEQGNSA